MCQALDYLVFIASLSARRAWIEMVIAAVFSRTTVVALRKESVDRNLATSRQTQSTNFWSLSARRAWIEICYNYMIMRVQPVALRKESVDRNKLKEVE